MYSFMDKCTLFFGFFNKSVADEVVWYREDKIPTSLICVSLRSKSFVPHSISLQLDSADLSRRW